VGSNLLFLLKLGSRRQINWLLRKKSAVLLSHLQILTGTDTASLTTITSDDTVKDLFARLDVEQLQALVQKMVRHLIEQRKLEHARLLDQYYLIALDATGLFNSPFQNRLGINSS
jgi:hypothetical protein